MPVQIGAKVHDFSNPTALLQDCHGRILFFLGALEAVAKVLDCAYDEAAARSLSTALQYFREAAPKHNADEEESLFPRLRRLGHPQLDSIRAHLQALESEHQWAAPLHAEVDRLGRQYLAKKQLSAAEIEKFRAAVAQLAGMYRDHIRLEDELIFPAAARLLSAAECAAIAREMAARRHPATPARGESGHS